ncbi:protein kinase [Streptomyces sp. NPDC020800]|uniref:phthiocerol/phthiodiolone dimycocerosyl transferase family protein n=1 Tax=Streptomyces sp. NPDC020800 TaxID=3365092 RepID=UPI0037B1B1D7
MEDLYVSQRSRGVASCVLDGPVDVAALSTAFEQAKARQPTLLTRIVPTPTGHALALLSEAPRLHLRIWTRDESAYRQELNTPLPVGGPLVRVTLFSTPDGKRHLFVLAVDHLIGDGRSMITLLNRVWSYYQEHTGLAEGRCPPPEPTAGFPAPVSTLLPRSGEGEDEEYAKRRIEDARLHPVELVPYDIPASGRNEAAQPHQIDVQRILLGAHQTSRLLERTRTERLTAHALLSTALLMSARRCFDGEGLRDLACLSPIDLRPRLSPPLPADTMVAAVTAHLQRLAVSPGSEPLQLARRVNNELRDFLKRGSHFREMRIMPAVRRHPALQLSTVIVSNMGKMTAPCLPGGLHMSDVRLVPARENYYLQAGRSPIMASAVSFQGQLAIELPYHTACFSTALMRKLRDDTRAILLAFAGEQQPFPAPKA